MSIFKNFAITTIATAPSPSTTGTSLTVSSGKGAIFPTPPFNVTIWPIGEIPLNENAEIVKVTNIAGDVFTITRQQENTNARSIQVGDQIAATITAGTVRNMNTLETSAAGYSIQDVDEVIVQYRTSNSNIYLPNAIGSGKTITVKNIDLEARVSVIPSGFELIDNDNEIVFVYSLESIKFLDYAIGKWITI
jgi:hypothetical protein